MPVRRGDPSDLPGYSGRYVAGDEPLGPVRTTEPAVRPSRRYPATPSSVGRQSSPRPEVVARINLQAAYRTYGIYGDVSLVVFTNGRIGIALTDLRDNPELLDMLREHDTEREAYPTDRGDRAVLLNDDEIEALAGLATADDAVMVNLEDVATNTSTVGEGKEVVAEQDK